MAEEKEFEKKVKKYLKDKGCWILKTWSNGVQQKGTPDLLACCNGYFLAVELKANNGKATKLQMHKIEEIRKAGGVAMVIYPDTFEAFKILVNSICEQETNDFLFNYQWIFDSEVKLK